ncbi:ABC transporter permease subunit [Thalassobacillus hwangdonensis]|uniref:ABC transporter permease subunit n=1 Tax=Thalassobacillus hwangdonensis TaxID=546108 RepID=A0ABW3L4R1_9BACI
MTFGNYFKKLKSILIGLLIISLLPSIISGANQTLNLRDYQIDGVMYDIFPGIFEKYFYSMTILLGGLALSICVAILFTFIASMLSRSFKRLLYGVLTILESLPDLFIVVTLQIVIIYVYAKTGWLISDLMAVNDERIYLLPILVLAVLPTIQLFKLSFLFLEEEANKHYIQVARSMGLGKLYIVIRHVFRNVLFHLSLYFKPIFVFMLSNLFIVEYIFNIHGVMRIMLSSNSFVFLIGTFMIAIPFVYLFEMSSTMVQKYTGEREEEAA